MSESPAPQSGPLEQARALQAAERFEEAADAFERALREGRLEPADLLAYAETLRAAKRYEDAAKAAQQAAASAKEPTLAGQALILLGDVNVDLGRDDEAKAAYARAAAVGGEVAGVAKDRLEQVGRPTTQTATLQLSPSVRRVVDSLGDAEVPAAALAARLLSAHPEYGNRTARLVSLPPQPAGPSKPAHEWLADIRSLFEPALAPELHGRLVLVGLALLDPTVRSGLEAHGALEAIREELKEPFSQLLTDRGRALGEGREAPRPRREETVPTHTDNPAKVDELGRKALARILDRRIRDIRTEEAKNAAREKDKRARRGGAFLVHIHAPWGAGKTTLLNFLADELHKEPRWVVVNFNAWRHQRIVPPWWWLMTTMYSESVRELGSVSHRRALGLRLREWFWRVKGGWPGFLVLVLGAGVLVLIWKAGFLRGLSGEKLFSRETAKAFLIAAAAIVTPILTLWGFVRGVSRWIFATSARGARQFIDNTRDPMQLVHEHVRDIVEWTGCDVVVLIDDLDRCKGPYVVELLEGIQTLFGDVPLTFVVAADRDWLADSYAEEYAKFVSSGAEPGRPLGYLFLEKTFQISAGLPPVGPQLEPFWNRLLRSPSLPSEEELDRARKEAARELAGRPLDEARREIAANPGASAAQVQARLEEVAVEMASERAARDAAHALQPFGRLLGRDPNPRAMKRLVNAWGIARGIETLHGVNLEGDHLREQKTALWTILNLRWPKLGDYLAQRPHDVELIGNGAPPSSVPIDLQPLFTDPAVVAVVRGDAPHVGVELDASALESVTLLLD